MTSAVVSTAFTTVDSIYVVLPSVRIVSVVPHAVVVAFRLIGSRDASVAHVEIHITGISTIFARIIALAARVSEVIIGRNVSVVLKNETSLTAFAGVLSNTFIISNGERNGTSSKRVSTRVAVIRNAFISGVVLLLAHVVDIARVDTRNA